MVIGQIPTNQDSPTTFKPNRTCIFLSARARYIRSKPDGRPCIYIVCQLSCNADYKLPSALGKKGFHKRSLFHTDAHCFQIQSSIRFQVRTFFLTLHFKKFFFKKASEVIWGQIGPRKILKSTLLLFLITFSLSSHYLFSSFTSDQANFNHFFTFKRILQWFARG